MKGEHEDVSVKVKRLWKIDFEHLMNEKTVQRLVPDFIKHKDLTETHEGS